jgi:hypothetical protein
MSGIVELTYLVATAWIGVINLGSIILVESGNMRKQHGGDLTVTVHLAHAPCFFSFPFVGPSSPQGCLANGHFLRG